MLQLDILSQPRKFLISFTHFFLHLSQLILEFADHQLINSPLMSLENLRRVVHYTAFPFEFKNALHYFVILFFEELIFFLNLFEISVNIDAFQRIEFVAFLFVLGLQVLVLILDSCYEVCIFSCPEVLVLEFYIKGTVGL